MCNLLPLRLNTKYCTIDPKTVNLRSVAKRIVALKPVTPKYRSGSKYTLASKVFNLNGINYVYRGIEE